MSTPLRGVIRPVVAALARCEPVRQPEQRFGSLTPFDSGPSIS